MPVVRVTQNLFLDHIKAAFGAVIEVPDEDARNLVRLNLAVYVGEPLPLTDWKPAPREETSEEPAPVSLPRPYAPKQEWVDYALATDPDLTADKAQRMTKADLISRYGDRL